MNLVVEVNMMRGKPKSTIAEKLEWLKKHPEVWEKNQETIRNMMAELDLCSYSTCPSDIGLRGLVEKAKNESHRSAASRKH